MNEAPKPGYLHGPMRAAAGQLLLRFEEIRRQHRGEAGRQREDDVREFLGRFLPDKLGVASGEIVATDGTTSPQIDIIIYDALETPVFDRSGDTVVLPLEGVYAVVEVSSRLDRAKLRQDANKIRAVKQMVKNTDAAYFRREEVIRQGFTLFAQEWRDFPVLGHCFAYDSAELETLREELVALDEGTPLHERVDTVCSITKGCIAHGHRGTTPEGELIFTGWAGTTLPGRERFGISVTPEDQPGVALMLFYLLGCGPLVQAHTHPVNLTPYMEIR